MIKTIIWLILIMILAVGGYFWWLSTQDITAPAPHTSQSESDADVPVITPTTGTGTVPQAAQVPTGPSTSGNIIDPGSGAAQIVGSNLMLGIDENTVLGTYLVGYTGMTLYTYEKDTGASSTCYAQCAATWPPYIVSSSDTINTQYGVNASKASIITRADGTLQVVYDGHPLYFYSGDTQETTNGQGQGGVWYVIKP
jgi:predicted lipoprotein with Yx(FWY)xxD motif